MAVSAAATDGLKTTLMVQGVPTTTLPVQVVEKLKSVLAAAGEPPDTTAPVKPIGEAEALVNVTTFAAVAVPTVCGPKARLVGDTTSALVEPVPESVTVCGLEASPSMINRLEVSTPATDGVNTTLIVQEAPAARLEPHVSDGEVKSTSAATGAPLEILTPPNEMGVVRLFVRATVCAGVVVPTSCGPNVRLDGVTVTVGSNVSAATNPSEGPFSVG